MDFHVSAALLRRGQSAIALLAELAARLHQALLGQVEAEKAVWLSGRHIR
jgi:hypothetical protein